MEALFLYLKKKKKKTFATQSLIFDVLFQSKF